MNYFYFTTFVIFFSMSAEIGKSCLLNLAQKVSDEEIEAKTRFKIYSGSMDDAIDVLLKEPKVLYNSINSTKPLVIYIHGFREQPSDESIRTVVEAYLQRGTDNIILLDWSDLAFENYVTVASRVPDVARALAETLDRLVQLGLNLKTLHVIGHSLGAQIAGLAGKRSQNTIPRITALDPANPGFYHPGAEHIDAESALYVDVIHTDSGIYGALVSTGTVDFYANSGSRPQPGCPLLGIPLSEEDLCSHQRSWRYYAESVIHERAFLAVQCNSYVDFVMGKCKSNRRVYVGYSVPRDTRGTFYFTTNQRSPFSKNRRSSFLDFFA